MRALPPHYFCGRAHFESDNGPRSRRSIADLTPLDRRLPHPFRPIAAKIPALARSPACPLLVRFALVSPCLIPPRDIFLPERKSDFLGRLNSSNSRSAVQKS